MAILRRKRRARHVERMRKMRNTYTILAPKHEANEQFEYLDIDEKIILRYRFTP
jgi:hypothetical protein